VDVYWNLRRTRQDRRGSVLPHLALPLPFIDQPAGASAATADGIIAPKSFFICIWGIEGK